MPEDFVFVAARHPSLDDEEAWGLYLPDQQRWIDIVFRSQREAERVIEEMRQAKLDGAEELAASS